MKTEYAQMLQNRLEELQEQINRGQKLIDSEYKISNNDSNSGTVKYESFLRRSTYERQMEPLQAEAKALKVIIDIHTT